MKLSSIFLMTFFVGISSYANNINSALLNCVDEHTAVCSKTDLATDYRRVKLVISEITNRPLSSLNGSTELYTTGGGNKRLFTDLNHAFRKYAWPNFPSNRAYSLQDDCANFDTLACYAQAVNRSRKK